MRLRLVSLGSALLLSLTLMGILGCPSETGSVSGLVLDVQGRPIQGALVSVEGLVKLTSETGYFQITGVSAGQRLLKVTGPDGPLDASWYYLDGIRTVRVSAGGDSTSLVTLQQRGALQEFDAAVETTLKADRTRVVIPAGALVDELGDPPAGLVQAYITPIHVDTDERWAAPPLIGESANDEVVSLITGGMIDARFFQDGKPLNLAAGTKARLELEVSGNPLELTEPSQENRIPMWWYDESSGLWKEDPDAVGWVQAPSTEGGAYTLVAEVGHFSRWNYDYSSSSYSVCVNGRVKRVKSDGNTVYEAGAYVYGITYKSGSTGTASNAAWYSYGYINSWANDPNTSEDETGYFCIQVMSTLYPDKSSTTNNIPTYFWASKTLSDETDENGNPVTVYSDKVTILPLDPDDDGDYSDKLSTPSVCKYGSDLSTECDLSSGSQSYSLDERMWPVLMPLQCLKGSVADLHNQGIEVKYVCSAVGGCDPVKSDYSFQQDVSLYADPLELEFRDANNNVITTAGLDKSAIADHVSTSCNNQTNAACAYLDDNNNDLDCKYDMGQIPASTVCQRDAHESDNYEQLQSGSLPQVAANTDWDPTRAPVLRMCSTNESNYQGYVNDYSELYDDTLKEGDRITLELRTTTADGTALSTARGKVQLGLLTPGKIDTYSDQCLDANNAVCEDQLATLTYHIPPGGTPASGQYYHSRIFSPSGNLDNNYQVQWHNESCYDLLSGSGTDHANTRSAARDIQAIGYFSSAQSYLYFDTIQESHATHDYQWLCQEDEDASNPSGSREDWYKISLAGFFPSDGSVSYKDIAPHLEAMMNRSAAAVPAEAKLYLNSSSSYFCQASGTLSTTADLPLDRQCDSIRVYPTDVLYLQVKTTSTDTNLRNAYRVKLSIFNAQNVGCATNSSGSGDKLYDDTHEEDDTYELGLSRPAFFDGSTYTCEHAAEPYTTCTNEQSTSSGATTTAGIDYFKLSASALDDRDEFLFYLSSFPNYYYSYALYSALVMYVDQGGTLVERAWTDSIEALASDPTTESVPFEYTIRDGEGGYDHYLVVWSQGYSGQYFLEGSRYAPSGACDDFDTRLLHPEERDPWWYEDELEARHPLSDPR